MSIETPDGPRSVYPDIVVPAKEIVPDALIMKLTRNVGDVEGDAPFVRVPYVATDAEAGFTDEGAEITESDPDLDEITFSTKKLAALSKISREANSYPTAANLVGTSLTRTITRKANVALLSNPVTEGQLTGLVNIAGIHDYGMLGNSLDAVEDALTWVESFEDDPDIQIVMDALGWSALRKLKKQTGSNDPLLGSPAEQTTKRIFGVDVTVTASAPSNTILIFDRNNVYSAVGPVLGKEDPSVYFTSDSIARRVTWRIGWKALHPNRIAKVSFVGGAPS